MRATCKYTGLQLTSSSGFARWCVLSEHPIFNVSLDELIQLAAIEWSPEMFMLDKKLLVLAIAKNCELITWGSDEANSRELVYATPANKAIESSIQPLLQIAGWIDFQRSVNKHSNYPSYLITTETATMDNFSVMLNDIILSRDYTEKTERREHRLICLENNARNLSAKCVIGANKEKTLLSTTAEWAMMVTEEALNAERVNVSIRNYWKKLLMTSATEARAKGFSLADIEELHEFLTNHLPHGSVIAHDVIAHTQRLLSVNSFNDIDGGTILSARVLTNGSLIAATHEPRREEFASVIEYARARANWLLVEHQREETAKDLARLAAALKTQARYEDNENDI